MKVLSHRNVFARRLALTSVALVGTALTPLAAHAQDATWNGPGTTFGTAGNWTPNAVPGSRAIFANTGPTTVNVLASTTLEQFQFNAGAPSYNINNQASLTLTGINGIGIENLSTNIQNINNTGTLTLNNANVVATNGAIGILNNGTFGTAQLVLNGTSQFGTNVQVQLLGGNVAVAGSTASGGSATTTFNGTSGADNIFMNQVGGSAQAVGQGGNDASATGGAAATTFNDNAHADGAVILNFGGTSIAGANGNAGLSFGGVATIFFNDNSHADGATITNADGGTSAAADFDGQGAIADGGSAAIFFRDNSHADNASFNNVGSGGIAIGGAGRSGTPTGNAAAGGDAFSLGGSVGIGFYDNSHANGAQINNTMFQVTAIGGEGGAGDTGAGGTGGAAQTLGANVSLIIADNAKVNNATITSSFNDAVASGGMGGTGGASGAGGTGGQATAGGGNIGIIIQDNASVNGTIFNNTGGRAIAIGGQGGAGTGGNGTGGTGGASNSTGGSVNMFITGNVTLGAGTVINNTAGAAQATGGKGGDGGAIGAGGTGGTATATGGNANLIFSGNSSAGLATIVNWGGATSATGGNGGDGTTGAGGDGGTALAIQGQALVEFRGSSTAGAATIENHAGPAETFASGASGAGPAGGNGANGNTGFSVPEIRFSSSATGGSAHLTNDGGVVNVNDNAVFGTAAGGGARIDNANNGFVGFNSSGSLGNGLLNNSDGTGFAFVTFGDTSSAGTGTIVNNDLGRVTFQGTSTLGNGTIINNAGGIVTFQGASDAVAGSLVENAGSVFNVNVNGLRLGSLTGNGDINLGFNTLQVGYLDRNETFGGTFGPAGDLIKRGTGTFTLTGNSIFNGVTTIEAGALQFGNGGTSGIIATDIVDNASLIFNRSDNVTFLNQISGTGTLTKTGAGTLILTGANTYAGGTTISQGILQIGNGGGTGSITGNVIDNANITFNRSNILNFGGVISGSGSLTQAGTTGLLILSGDNTYTGGTTISGGTLQIGAGGTTGSVAGNIVDNANLVFFRSNAITYGGVISGTGTVTKAGAGTLILTGNNSYTGLTTVSTGTLQIGNGGTSGSVAGNILNNNLVSFDRSDTTTYGGVISGSGIVTQAGSGTLVLTGANTYAGGTLVTNGTLQLNGSVASAIQVLAAGRLTGTGIVNGNIVAAGVVAPGTAANPFGTLTTTNGAFFNAGSFLAPTIGAGGQSSLLQANALTINGGSIVRPTAVSGGLFLLQTDYRIANGTTGRTGTFSATVDESLLPTFLDASIFYSGNDVFLRVKRNATTFAQTTGLTPNQLALSTSLDAAVAANNPAAFTTYLTTYNALLPLSGAQLQGALNILSGDALTAIPVAAQGQADRFADRLASYTWSNSSNLWGLIAYGDQHADSDGNGPGFRSNGLEFQMGFNTSLGHDTRLGLSVGYNDGDVGIGQRLASVDIESWSIGARLRHDFGQLYAAGQFTYSWHDVDSSRTLFLPGTATAHYDASTWTAEGELGWVIQRGQLSIEPHVSIRHASTSTDAYSESGPVGALNVAAADYNTTRVGIGVRLANRVPEAPIRFSAMLRYERETGDNQSVLDNGLPGLPTYRVVGTRLGDDILTGELGAEVQLSSGLSLFAAGSGHIRSNETSVQANAGLRVRF